jgi:hypothetical protein
MERVQILAQILREDVNGFLAGIRPCVKAEVYDAFARAGTKAVVAEGHGPLAGSRAGKTWIHVYRKDFENESLGYWT